MYFGISFARSWALRKIFRGRAMTFREKLADWISGGALSRARDDAEWLDRKRSQWATRAIVRQDALRCITDMETLGANATVRRMAKTAREALQ